VHDVVVLPAHHEVEFLVLLLVLAVECVTVAERTLVLLLAVEEPKPVVFSGVPLQGPLVHGKFVRVQRLRCPRQQNVFNDLVFADCVDLCLVRVCVPLLELQRLIHLIHLVRQDH